MIQMIQYPHTDTAKYYLEDDLVFIYQQKMIQHIQRMILYIHTEIAEDDPVEIDDEDV